MIAMSMELSNPNVSMTTFILVCTRVYRLSTSFERLDTPGQVYEKCIKVRLAIFENGHLILESSIFVL